MSSCKQLSTENRSIDRPLCTTFKVRERERENKKRQLCEVKVVNAGVCVGLIA